MGSAVNKGIVLLAGVFAAATCGAETLRNPLLDSGADPWVIWADGFYYYMNTLGDRLEIRKTARIENLRDAERKVVWRAPARGPDSTAVWAPELHRIDGKWFVYFTAADKAHNDDAHRHIFVLENDAKDPLAGSWLEHGMLKTRYSGIDGTVFSDHGRWYFAYSAYVGPDSDLLLAPLRNPWTLAGTEVDIAHPTFDWEKQGGRQILEGPEFLEGKRGQRILMYSASACWSDDYSIGMLVAGPGADLLQADSWRKSPEPVFTKSVRHGVYAPGHNGLFKSPDGREDWIIYHANSAPGERCDQRRSPRIQKFSWKSDGLPDFGEPVASGTELNAPAAR